MRDTLRELSAPLDAKIHRNLVYAQVDGKPLLLDLALPAVSATQSAKPAAGLPLVIWIHGGGWKAGSKDGTPAGFLLREGFAIASINYRLTDVATFPAQIHDCKAAVRLLRAKADEFGLDAKRIGVWGGSAGGHLVALLGVSGDAPALEGKVGEHLDQSSRVQAVCDWFGPTLFDVKDLPVAVAGNEMVVKLLGGPIYEKRELAQLASPALQVTPTAAPFLIVHGEKDPIVPLFQSQVFANRLKAAGVEATFEAIPEAGHGGAAFLTPERRGRIVDFFSRHLRPAQTGGGSATAPAR
ncbi:MAG: alpha/beta hydrolase [Planctomycetota bacterium]|nr:alpha/beta hydrolase [Planctomycetota bacterium]